jgi:hypothetical protein
MSAAGAPQHHRHPLRRMAGHRRPHERLSNGYLYQFAALLFLLIIVVNVALGSVSGLLPLPVLAICAPWLIAQR